MAIALSVPPNPHAAAVRYLKKADARLAAVIESVGPCRFKAVQDGTHFDAVARSIVYQQLSGKAAGTIHSRFLALFPGAPDAAELLRIPDELLRGAGLSRQKASYLRSLAEHATAGSVPFHALDALDDESVIDALVSVKGVGRWTAQMFLMFRLGRPDVLPELDLGVQKGIQRAYRLRSLPPPKKVLQIGAKWAPYRSIASWYLWRSLDNGAGQAG